jgi:membrane-bound lytic murein transglycosylase D
MKRHHLWNLGLFMSATAMAADPPPPNPPASPEAPSDAVYQAGKDLFDQMAPPEVKAQFEFPNRAEWDDFVTRLQRALDGDDPAALAQLEPDARSALAILRLIPGSDDYTGWLEERLDDIEAAKEIGQRPASLPPAAQSGQFIPNYDLCLHRLQSRARPVAADKYVALLQPVFAAGDVPGALVWLAEVESGFNPTARSPAGARGLFQLMPGTARELGLRTSLPDERTDPGKSAQAAARMLRGLHAKFGDWPLALAAYNAGPARVQRALDQQRARTFAEIASVLPVEARLYVPKVLAVLKIRAGVSLAGPGAP